MKCKKCGKAFIPCKGLINYCSITCRNSRKPTEAANKQRAKTWHIRWNSLSIEEKEKYVNSRSKYRPIGWETKQKETWRKKYLALSWDQLGIDGKKRRVKEEQNNSCNKCKLNQWLNVSIILEIDHIDGFSDNNLRENLEALCPNCHSLTPTWRGRNKPSRNGKNKVSDKEILTAIEQCGNIRQVLLMVGMAPKGDNYSRVKKLMGL